MTTLAAEAGAAFSIAGADPSGVDVTGVTLDSRAVGPGDLYAALPGANVHGATFAAQAVFAGAAALLTDAAGVDLLPTSEPVGVPVLVVDDVRGRLGAVSSRVYGDPAAQLSLVGITGTNGKTTTAYILDAANRALGLTTGLIGTIATRIATRQVPSVRTTPEACDLHRLFALMREAGVSRVTMEVSSHAVALHRVDAAVYDVALFTNLSQDHLDFHGTMESYFQAKAALFTPERARRGVVVVDDEWGSRLAADATIPVVTLTAREGVDADWRIVGTPGEPGFDLVGPTTTMTLRSALPGDFNRVNTALAALALEQLGHSPSDIVRALAADPAIPGRMQRVDLGDGAPQVVVDFAHTPDAIGLTLAALRPRARTLVAVLGAGGSRDPGKRAAMGAAAAHTADVVIVTDDNPRNEDPADIRAAVAEGARTAISEAADHPAELREIPGRREAIRAALEVAGPQGVVAILGKGHEQGQEVAGVTHPYDDVTAARDAWQDVRSRKGA